MKKLNQVLLIDDDEITNYLNKKIIEKFGLSNEILVALNGLEALQILNENCNAKLNCPDLILLDLNMPLMNGFEFLEEFQRLEFKNKQSVVLFLLTTSSHQKDLEKVERFNIQAVLNKPLTLEKLEKAYKNVSFD